MRTILRLALRDHLQSLQFIVLLFVGIVLFSANGIIFAGKYRGANAAYQQTASASQPQPDTRMAFLSRRPNPFLFLAEGGDLDRPSSFTLMAKGHISPLPIRPRDYKLPDIPKLDWAFIIKTIFSLYVIMLGYAAVSGEREDGTLRLVLSNPVGRARFLMGKFAAVLTVALIPLVVGGLVSLVVLSVFQKQSLTMDLFGRVLLLLALSAAYLSLFAFLSLLFSALIGRSSLALLALLGAWVLFAVIIPDSSGILSRQLAKVPSDFETAKNLGPLVEREVWGRIAKIQGRIDRGEIKTEAEIRVESERAFGEGQDKMRFYQKGFADSVASRQGLARSLYRLSPMALFQFAAEDIVRSGPNAEADFLDDLRDYSGIYDAYVLKKTGKLVGQSNWSFSTSVNLNGKTIDIQSPQAPMYRGDMSDFPKFTERKTSALSGVGNALGDIAGLLAWNIVLAGLAFAAFVRSDIR
jgi:ABC-type transport system involved in multi-copper enzyme maturation permease subunit